MQFGKKVRSIRREREMTQQRLADKLHVSVSYISKIENGRLSFGDYPSEKFIHKLASELETDEDELLMLADKVPASIRKRIRERPDVFRVVAGLDDVAMDKIVKQHRNRK